MKIAAIILALATLSLSACDAQPEGEPVLRVPVAGGVAEAPVDTSARQADANTASDCRSTIFEDTSFTHCIADPARHRISTALASNAGSQAGTIAGWLAGRETTNLAFAMNAGMYDDDLKPIGYFVQDAQRLATLNRAEGPGNFHLKPNGVFFGSDGTWQVLDSATFERTVGDRPKFGTQSGPMLVIEGELHPEFSDDGPSRAIRNGVGVDEAGRAHLVISDAPVSFGRFARFFRDELKTPNALFLDGNVSSLWDPGSGRKDAGRVGPLLVVERKP